MESLQRAFGRGRGPAGHPPRRGEGLRGRGRPRARARPTSTTTTRAASSRPSTCRPRSRRRPRGWREKLVEMVAESNEDLMEEFFEKGTLPQEDLVRGPAPGGARRPHLPRAPRLVDAQRRRASAPGRDRRPPALARRPRRGGGHRSRQEGRRSRASPRRTRRSPRSSSRPSPIRTPGASPLPRLLRHVQVRHHGAQHHPRRAPSASATCELLQGKTQTPVPEIQAGRHRRGGQAQGDADRRHPVRQGAPDRRTRRSSTPSRPPPSPWSPRRAATRTRSRPRCTG